MPMSPIFLPRTQLTDLRFFAVPPEIIPPSPTITRDPRRPVKDSGVSEKGTLYLTVTSLEFEDCTSTPMLILPRRMVVHVITRFVLAQVEALTLYDHTWQFSRITLGQLLPIGHAIADMTS